jgi:hypothetical protein
MAKRRVEKITPRPKPEFVRAGTTTPSSTGEVPSRSPIAPDEFRREVSPVPTALLNGDVPNVNPNPDPSFLVGGKPVPVPLADDSDTD